VALGLESSGKNADFRRKTLAAAAAKVFSFARTRVFFSYHLSGGDADRRVPQQSQTNPQ
jgi:hypothetical protein